MLPQQFLIPFITQAANISIFHLLHQSQTDRKTTAQQSRLRQQQQQALQQTHLYTQATETQTEQSNSQATQTALTKATHSAHRLQVLWESHSNSLIKV